MFSRPTDQCLQIGGEFALQRSMLLCWNNKDSLGVLGLLPSPYPIHTCATQHSRRTYNPSVLKSITATLWAI